MPTITVPKAVQRAASRAIVAKKDDDCSGAAGCAVAERLATGFVGIEDIQRMRRFFTVNERAYREAVRYQHTSDVSSVLLSWELYGGASGKVWAEEAYTRAVSQGEIEEDDWVRLLRSSPDRLYQRFALGAWKWEYGLTPDSAARFVEAYQKSTGVALDLEKAFGSSVGSVSDAIRRRLAKENPFRTLSRVMTRASYRSAAMTDLQEMRESIGQPVMAWPPLVAYSVLVLRAPSIVEEYLEGFPAYPRGRDEPECVLSYREPFAEAITYLRPGGARYCAVGAPSRILVGLQECLLRVGRRRDRVMDESRARDVLRAARVWTASSRLAGGVCHVLLEAWKDEDWGLFLDALPLESDIRAPFQRFASEVI